jgi:LysM repeat protein
MKHLLNNLSEEEKNRIREQHTGGMKVNNDRFNSLLENKLGNAKPLINEDNHWGSEIEEDKIEDLDNEDSFAGKSSDYRMYDLPSIHQDIEDELMEMSDEEGREYLKEIIEFCEDKLNDFPEDEDDFEDEDTLNEQSTEDVNKGKKTGCYTVKSGDTVLAIAKKFGITLDDVRALNGMTSTDSITPGQKLRVKNGTKFIGC